MDLIIGFSVLQGYGKEKVSPGCQATAKNGRSIAEEILRRNARRLLRLARFDGSAPRAAKISEAAAPFGLEPVTLHFFQELNLDGVSRTRTDDAVNSTVWA